MKKISSMLALGMALTLTFGMTVSAKESPSTQNPDYKPTQAEITAAENTIKELNPVSNVTSTVTLKDTSGNEVKPDIKPIGAETVAELQSTGVIDNVIGDMSAEMVDEVIEKAMQAVKQTVEDGKRVEMTIDPKPVAAAVISLPANTVIPEEGIQLEISLPGFTPKPGTAYVLMHLNSETNKWEIIAPDAIADGKVTATFSSLSPVTVNEAAIAILPIPAGEEYEAPDEWAEPRHPEQQAGAAPTSPKTAETLPAAGFIALICLAGAAVCAGRIRYNK